MVKNSRELKKLLSVFLIMCLAASMLLTTSFASTEGTQATSTTPVTGTTGLSPLQLVIEQVLSITDEQVRKDFTKNVLDSKEETRVSDIQELIPALDPNDIEAALAQYDKLSKGQRNLICTFINAGIPATVNVQGIKSIAKKINGLVNNKEEDPDNFGVRLTLALLDNTSRFSGLNPVVFDGDANAKKIQFKYAGILEDSFNAVIDCIGTLKAKNIDTFDELLERAAAVINNAASDTEIANFKAYLNQFNPKNPYIYKKTSPAPTSGNGGSSGGNGGGGGVVDTPAATPTSTATLAPTDASTTVPTPTPTAGKPSDKQITSFSFKDPAAKGVIFENLRTIVVKVPMGTDLKNLVPTIEYKGDSIKPESDKKKNFSHPVFYTVTAADKSKARYVVIVYRGDGTTIEEPETIKPGVGPYGDIFGHWAEDNLIGLIESGIITGYPDGSIKPNTHMTRAEVVTLIVKALGLSPAKDANLSFKDSKTIPSWAQGYIKTALDKGFIKGYPDNTIKPMDKVTRAEFTVMIMKAFAVDLSKNEELKFNDAKSAIPDWAKQQIAAAVKLGIIKGYDDNTFKPNNFITRAEVGAIIDRCFGVSGMSYPEL